MRKKQPWPVPHPGDAYQVLNQNLQANYTAEKEDDQVNLRQVSGWFTFQIDHDK